MLSPSGHHCVIVMVLETIFCAEFARAEMTQERIKRLDSAANPSFVLCAGRTIRHMRVLSTCWKYANFFGRDEKQTHKAVNRLTCICATSKVRVKIRELNCLILRG